MPNAAGLQPGGGAGSSVAGLPGPTPMIGSPPAAAIAVAATPQVEGAAGLSSLGAKVSKGGPTVLYHGALAASAATFVGHYPWFATVRAGSAFWDEGGGPGRGC